LNRSSESVPALKHVLELVETVASSDSTVLLLGDTGTGKELIARAIHDPQPAQGSHVCQTQLPLLFRPVCSKANCLDMKRGRSPAAISQKDRFGWNSPIRATLFLDEVGDIPTEIQPKLLRALQEREFRTLRQHPHEEGQRKAGCCNQPRLGKDDWALANFAAISTTA